MVTESGPLARHHVGPFLALPGLLEEVEKLSTLFAKFPFRDPTRLLICERPSCSWTHAESNSDSCFFRISGMHVLPSGLIAVLILHFGAKHPDRRT